MQNRLLYLGNDTQMVIRPGQIKNIGEICLAEESKILAGTLSSLGIFDGGHFADILRSFAGGVF